MAEVSGTIVAVRFDNREKCACGDILYTMELDKDGALVCVHESWLIIDGEGDMFDPNFGEIEVPRIELPRIMYERAGVVKVQCECGSAWEYSPDDGVCRSCARKFSITEMRADRSIA